MAPCSYLKEPAHKNQLDQSAIYSSFFASCYLSAILIRPIPARFPTLHLLKVLETAHCYVMLDAFPVARFHCLLLPKVSE